MATRLIPRDDLRRLQQAARIAHGVEPDPSPWATFRALQRHEQAAVVAGGVLAGLFFLFVLPVVLAVLAAAIEAVSR